MAAGKGAFICVILITVVTILSIGIIPAVTLTIRRRLQEFDSFAAGGGPGGGPSDGPRGPGIFGVGPGLIAPNPIGGQLASQNPNAPSPNFGNGRAPLPGVGGPTDPVKRAAAVRQAFQFAWQGYFTHAFPHDELRPADNSPGDSRNGWGATAVDALSTAIVMQLPDVVGAILKHIAQVDWTRTVQPVSVFETNIRYLGGMISGYDLLCGPFASLPHDKALRDQLLVQARKLADMLAYAFQTPSGIPDNILHFNQGIMINGSTKASLATIGTLQLEWARLSRLLNDPKYAQLSQKPMKYLLQPKSVRPGILAEPFPGLVGQYLSIQDGSVVDQTGGWGPESDSFYEYLLKMYIYKPSDFGNYRDRWVQAVESSMTYLASRPHSKPDLTFLAHWDGTKLLPHAWHLDCFAGGNIILGGSVLKQQRYIDFGLAVVDGCRAAYAATTTRIGPEAFAWVPTDCIVAGVQIPSHGPGSKSTAGKPPGAKLAARSPEIKEVALNVSSRTNAPVGNAPLVPATVDCTVLPGDLDTHNFFTNNGLWIADGAYGLRPETMESYYYAWRVTKDPKYRDWAWEAFSAIADDCRLQNGFNFLNNVNAIGGQNGIKNVQESYFFAETLMYAYAIFAEDGEWQANFNGGNRFVFNTEGHPIHVSAA